MLFVTHNFLEDMALVMCVAAPELVWIAQATSLTAPSPRAMMAAHRIARSCLSARSSSWSGASRIKGDTESGSLCVRPGRHRPTWRPPTSEDAKARESNVPDLISATLSFRQILDWL
jgi:hypothetical protein